MGKKEEQGLIYSSVVAIVAVVGLVMLFTGNGSGAFAAPGDGSTFAPRGMPVDLKQETDTCKRIVVPGMQGYCFANCMGQAIWCQETEGYAPGFGTPGKIQQGNTQGYFAVDGGVTAQGAIAKGTFGPSREFLEGARRTNCWDTPQGRECFGYDQY